MLAHLNARDVTLIGLSHAPIEKLPAYKRRMGWQFPYVQATQAVADALPSAESRSLSGQTHDINPKVQAPMVEELFTG